MKTKRIRVALALAAVGAVASTSVSATLALYSNRPTGETNTFVAGTVTETNVTTGACSTTNMVPGDSTSCTLATTYNGAVTGYMALDVFIATKSSSSGGATPTNLYNPSDASGEAQITVSSATPTVNYIAANTNFGTAVNCTTGFDGTSYSTYTSCYLLSNMLVASTAFTNPATVTFTTGILLPTLQPNSYQGSSAVVVLSAHSVQSRNNTINCAGGATPGAVCTPAGSFAWS